jgi:hypothetical protein
MEEDYREPNAVNNRYFPAFGGVRGWGFSPPQDFPEKSLDTPDETVKIVDR